MTTPSRPGPRSGPGPSSDPGSTATDIGRTLPATPADVAALVARPGAGNTADASSSPLLHRRLAHFRLEKPVGKGGMGEVWLATDLALDRPVAIKLLSRELSSDPSLRERFYREARAQARIQHANVGHIYFIGEEDGQLFFAMEFIVGQSLAERLAEGGKLPVSEAIELCRQAALGLREAHRHGFTHRDVKPSNLMLDRHGTVKIVDFGLVKQEQAENVALTLESGGGAMGTPLYMAPEQAKSGIVDFRTDIYALGATLHHLVAGTPPFGGDNPLQVVSKHLSEPRPHVPAVRKQNVLIDPMLDRMMAKDPGARFASYDDLLIALEQAAPSARRAGGFFVRASALALDMVFVLIALTPLAAVLPDPWGVIALNVALAIYPIAATARFGRTLGKWLLEIEVVPEGRHGRVSWRASTLRWAAQWGPLFAGALAVSVMFERWGGELETPAKIIPLAAAIALMVLPIVFGAIASVFRSDRRAWWDRVAGTRVRYRPRA